MQHCRKCPDAVAQIQGGMEAPQLSGCVEFYQENGCVLIVARISGLPKESATGFFGFIFIKGKAALGLTFLEQEVTMILLTGSIRTTQVICHRCCHVGETHICPLERIGFL